MAEKKQTGGTGKRAKSEKPAVLSGTVPEWSSTTAISQLLGKTVRRVQQLTQEGVLETEIPPGGGARKYRTCATVQRYVAYVEAKAQETGENSRAAELTLKKLEAEVELKESQGQLHRLKTAIAEGRYLAADHATEELTEFMASFKKFAMNIPPRMAGTMSGYPVISPGWLICPAFGIKRRNTFPTPGRKPPRSGSTRQRKAPPEKPPCNPGKRRFRTFARNRARTGKRPSMKWPRSWNMADPSASS